MTARTTTVVTTAVGLLLTGCDSAPTPPRVEADPFPPAPDDTLPYVYAPPPATGDGWIPGTVTEAGMSESRLTLLIDLVREGVYPRLHGIVIARGGRLVLEEYFNGRDFVAATPDSIIGPWTWFDRETRHHTASVTKSITSTLVGIALDEGLIESIDVSIMEFFPDYAALSTPARDSIRVRDLLTMTSGIDWDETSRGYGEPGNDIHELFGQNDPLGFILSKPITRPRGTEWRYSGANTILLGEIVARASGTTLRGFADERLFEPLGIAPTEWVQLSGSLTYASGDLRLRPRDMAKLGQLFLDRGVWMGQRIVSEEWVDHATAPHYASWATGWDYGFQWWLKDFDVAGQPVPTWWARGWGGQMITVVPSLDLVVVQTGGNYFTEDPANALVQQFVLPAVAQGADGGSA